LTWCDCLRDMVSEGRRPADTGVVGLETRRGLESGRGSEAELRRASRAKFSSRVGISASSRSRGADSGAFDLDGGRPDFANDLPLPGDLCGLPCVLPSWALAMRPSFARFDRVLPAVTVCARVGTVLFAATAGSDIVSITGRGFRAWATARGPAHCGNKGHAILARTKLPRTVTGRTFSVIFSCLAVSDSPNTTCCTLLYTRRQVLKASVWGFGERSCR
jgi:hypothetical protein